MRARIHILSLFAIIILFTQTGFAQQAELNTRISHIAGTTIYLDLGRDDGLSPGDTLFIYKESLYKGVLLVENVSSKTLSARYGTEDLFPLTRGELVTVRFEPPGEETAAPAGEIDTGRTSILESVGRDSRAQRIEPEITGRFMTGSSVMLTETQWGESIYRTTDRMFLSPFANLNLALHNLPNGFSADAAVSYSYRYSSDTPISPEHSARFYRLNIEKSFSSIPLALAGGRFYNRYDIFSGFWDGIMIRLGTREQGLGVLGGFEPDRGNEGISLDIPKYSLFAYRELNFSNIRSSTGLSFNAVLPSVDLANHLFAGLYQQVRIGRNRFTVNLQADRDPAGEKWILSQTLIRGTVALTEKWEFHGGYNRRLPYRLYFRDDPVGYERTQITGGTAFRLRSGYLGGDVSFNDSELDSPSRTVSAYGNMRSSRFWGIGYSASGSWWEGDTGRTLRLSPGLNRYFGKVYLQLGYDFYRSEFLGAQNQTHGGELSLMVPFFEQWILNVQARSEFGDLLIHNSLYVSIWRAF